MDTQELIIIEIFCQEYQIEKHLVDDLEAFGLLQTIQHNQATYIHKNQLVNIEKIIRLHNDLNINKEGIAVILDLLEKVNQLQTEVKHLNDRLGLYE